MSENHPGIQDQTKALAEEAKQIENHDKGDSEPMDENKILSLMQEVEVYKQAIQDARDALASAEMELDDTLDAEFNQ